VAPPILTNISSAMSSFLETYDAAGTADQLLGAFE